ncbi:MAG: hypothetical protein V4754_15545, partial [Pseudomonadota bacterium]
NRFFRRRLISSELCITICFKALPNEEKVNYQSIREAINHPNISGPFETGWGYTDFDGAGLGEKIGMPVLPGQTTILK